MTLPASCPPGRRRPARLVPTQSLSGAEQMALDALLLEQSCGGGSDALILRFYQWRRPTLSLGRHQGPPTEQWRQLAAAGDLDLVRRPSGGGAVLHAGGLTYALIWTDPPRQRRQAYAQVNQCLQEGLEVLGLHLKPGGAAATTIVADCFAQSTTADLVDSGGCKRIGSAQFWKRGHLLQHGEIPLDPHEGLWEAVFASSPPRWTPSAPSPASLELALKQSFQTLNPGLNWREEDLSQEEIRQMDKLTTRYCLEPDQA
ncbi:lipoate--protein ligase family protein [Synechococcus sp. A10-1-5-9]|uniref:lipoate--protein ligase family protein n=1 Tax=Synechococcus sp. A10-1-5-9 TaxID=3392295 RepID=UPI0039E9B0A6